MFPRLLRAGALALAATGVLAGSAHASVFVQTNDPAGNAVVVYDQGLHARGTYKTGGLGGALAGAAVDRLASQGSLVYADGLVYAVNAGSNSVTVFDVQGGDRLVRRQVIGSGGSFPVSIAVHGNRVFVLNARDGGSLQGYLKVADYLVPIPLWHRTLGLDPAATPEFTHTPGQVAFTPDGGQLLVTTKANTNAVDVFDVDPILGLSLRPNVNVLDGTVPFAIAFDARGQLALAEAGPSAVARFNLDRRGDLGAPLSSVATGQAATCWITAAGRFLYASNAGSASVSIIGPSGLQGQVSTHAGSVDSAASSDGRFLYVQGGAAGTVDAFRIGADGSLTGAGSVTVPGSAGGEGIAAS